MITKKEKRNVLESFEMIIRSNKDFNEYQKRNLVIDLRACLVLNNFYTFYETKSIERLLFYKIKKGAI